MKIKKKTIKRAFFILVIIALIYLAYLYFNKDPYRFKSDKFYYSENRGKTDYSLSLKESNITYDVYKINFKSKNFMQYPTTIYGLLFVPKNKDNFPGLVLLPGGGVTKESEANLAVKITELGYAVFTFDQRGIGETGGYYLNFDQDYSVFSKGNEPMQHLSVYDALKAYDVLKKTKDIDKDNIGIMGESMGGRYALIAAAIDKRLKGVIAISTSGFHVKKESTEYNKYLLSADPDNYIGDISPNYLFMFHGTNDTMVSMDDAKITFNLAKEPKKFFTAEGCGHGYCDKMYDNLKESLKILFGK